MAARHYLQLADGSTIEVTDRVEMSEGWRVTERAEEGSVGSGVMWLNDPGQTLDVDGLRAYTIVEDASEATDNVLFGGLVVDPEVSRGEKGSTHYDPIARAWQIQLTDFNGYWNRRVMVGTDCRRPAESDVARMQWLLTTAEAGWLDDATTYLATSSPSNMDKNDYRGQYLNQIVDDGAQHTGKNWWVQRQETGTGRVNVGWYGLDGLTTYSSDLLLSNDPADWLDAELAAGTSTVWPIDDDTKLRRDTSRVYAGVYLRYANGTRAIYRRRAASVTAYGYRDYVADYPNVRTKAKATARASRLLADLANPDERIIAKVRLPKGKATMLRAGMRVRFKATHLPGYTDWRWMRVLSVSIQPVGVGDQYDLGLELQGPGVAAPVAPAALGFIGSFEGGWPNGGFWYATLEAADDGVPFSVVLSSAEIAAAPQGSLIMFPTALRHKYWRIHLTENWNTVFQPGNKFTYSVLVNAANTADLFGNGWTPGGTNTTAVTSRATQAFVGLGPVDGFSMEGFVLGNPVGSYGGLTMDQTGGWRLNQTDIGYNVPRTLDYYWTWTL
jgi:hypothetical protein